MATAVVTSSGPARAAVVPAEVFSTVGSLKIRADGFAPCVTGPVIHPSRHHSAKSKVKKLVSTLEDALQDKEGTISKMIKKHEAALSSMQGKYTALYTHCTNLAQDLQRKEDKLELLQEGDKTQQVLCNNQKQLAKSTAAMLSKNKRTKFINGPYSLHYATTAPTEDVRDEMALAAAREREQNEQQEKAAIAKLLEVVDQLAKKYDRYGLYSTSNASNSGKDRDLFSVVPKELLGIWLFTMEPTKEELLMYEDHIRLQIRPPPIYSPPMPKPRVNWAKLNKFQLKNLPEPASFPVLSCPEDPAYYTTTYEKRYTHHCVGQVGCGCVRCDPPFGRAKGLRTNLGVIPMPTDPVHGYIWDGSEWVIAAY